MKLTVGTDDHWDIGGYVVLGSPESTQHKYRFFWTLNNADYSKRAMVPLLLDNLDFRSLISSLIRKNLQSPSLQTAVSIKSSEVALEHIPPMQVRALVIVPPSQLLLHSEYSPIDENTKQ